MTDLPATVSADAARGTPGSTDARRASATRIVVSTYGVVLAFAGVEHGIGEILQGPVAPASWVIESWPDTPAFEILAGEPAMTVIPNLLVAGILTVIVALAIGIWAVGFVHRPSGGLVVIGLSLLLLVVGGGFGPPLVGIIIGIGATRIGTTSHHPPGRLGQALGRFWPWILGAGVLGYLSLFPGTVLLSTVADVSEGAVYSLSAFSFAAVILSLIAARAAERLRMAKKPHILS